MSEITFDDRIARGEMVIGDRALDQALAWGQEATVQGAVVIEARRAGSIGCRVVEYADGYGKCVTCGNCWFASLDDDDE